MQTHVLKFGFIAFAIMSVVSCQTREVAKQDTVRKVKLATVERVGDEKVKEFSGVIKEAEQVNMGFRVAGSVQKIYVKEGDFVKKGQIVAELDSRDYLVQLNAVKVQYEQVKSETDRIKELYKRNSVAENDYDKAVAGEKMAYEKLKNAQDQYNDTKLRAPFSGYIQNIKYKGGELVGQGMTIASIINVDFYSIEIEIPSSLFIQKDDFVKFECYQTLLSEKAFPIEIVGHDIKANNNQLYKLYFRLDPSLDKRLAPGMDVKVDITTKGNVKSSMMIPVKAIFYENDNPYVWVYSSKDSLVSKQKIEISNEIQDGRISVLSGVEEGSQVVVAGVHVVKENQKVIPMVEVSKTNVGGLL